MRILTLAAAVAAMLASTACNADKSGTAANAQVTAKAVPAPNNGDWTTIVSATPQGGFVMGNPNAKVKLVEFGSLTCSHCAAFEEEGGKPLVDNYVKKGLVSWEFRNFVRDSVDVSASLVARCNGPASFFGMIRAIYADQPDWFGKVQAADAAKLQAIQNDPTALFKAYADIAGFPTFAAMRGVPKAKTAACLADPKAASQLVQMNSDAVSAYNIPGTPTFLINGKVVDATATWGLLEPKLKEALGS